MNKSDEAWINGYLAGLEAKEPGEDEKKLIKHQELEEELKNGRKNKGHQTNDCPTTLSLS